MARRGQAGFTLIEVLIAAALVGVGMAALVTAASRCLAVMSTAKRYQQVQWSLNLGELEYPILPSKDFHDWEVSGETLENGMVYSREVEEPDEERKDGMYLLRTRVTWSVRGHEGHEEVVQYIFVKDKAEL
jgi:prepilin-type N-terminal cleavage/methylation domain-containing protein